MATLTESKLQTADILPYLMAGNATVTFRSLKTGKHLTYKVQAPKNPTPGKPPVRFVKALTGSDNETAYTYIGIIVDGQFRTTAKTGLPLTSPAILAFRWAWEHIGKATPTPEMEVWHSGKCGRCGRKLTVPESIANGIGPECLAIMGGK